MTDDKKNISEEERIAMMFDLAERQQQAVTILLKELKDRIETLKKDVKGEIRSEVRESMSEVPKAAKTALNESVAPFSKEFEVIAEKARKASKMIEVLVESIGMRALKFFAIVTGTCLVVSLVAFFWLEYTISGLTDEKRELQENVYRLEKQGGRIKISECEGKPCVRIDVKNLDKQYGASGEYRLTK